MLTGVAIISIVQATAPVTVYTQVAPEQLAESAAFEAAETSQADPTAPPNTPQFSRPPGSAVTLSLPVVFRDRILGEAFAEVDPLDPTSIRINLSSLRPLLSPVLNEDGRERLTQLGMVQPNALLGRLVDAGIMMRFDPERLELVVERIEPRLSTVVSLFDTTGQSIPITLEQDNTSAYLNILPEFRTRDFENLDVTTGLFFAGRVGDFLLEVDGGYDSTAFGPGFFRRQARAIYDDFEADRRLSAGDLRILNLQLLGTAFVGGIGIEKGRRVFNPFIGIQTLGPQQFLLDERSTVEVYSAGALVDTLVLEPGAYDLASIPTRFGINDANLVIVDPSGQRNPLPFDFFFDPTDLQAGEDEYSATIGFPADDLNFNPGYSNEVAASGFYRRGLSNRLILGGGLQVREELVNGAVEAVISPRFLPGRFTTSFAFSQVDGETGFAAGFNYFLFGSASRGFGDLSLGITHQSREFATLAQRLTGIRSSFTTINANYTRRITDETSVLAAFSFNRRDFAPDFYLGSVEALRRIDDRFFLRGGFEFGTAQNGGTQLGVRATITARLGQRTRASARYSSVRDTFATNITRPARDVVDSFGYDVTFNQDEDRSELDFGGTFIGNRFEARGLALFGGDGFGNFDEDQILRLNFGTSIAVAGGQAAIGRPIIDSFLIAKTADVLGATQVIVGRSLREDTYDAISGDLGPAVMGRLASFSTQNITLDIMGENAFADIGSGVETVKPEFRSGYLLVVGNNGIISTVGTALIDGEPASLVSGTVASPDDADFEDTTFFTNSVGRFAIIGLRPGFTYVVETNEGRVFEIAVPGDATSLLRIGTVEFETEGM